MSQNGGPSILWLTGNRVSKGDVEAVIHAGSLAFPDLLEALTNGPSIGKESEWCRRILATLLKSGILEWKIVLPEKKGVFHEKGAVFKDDVGQSILLTGSWNETLAGYTANVERIDVHTQWDDRERCEEAEDWFDRVWHAQEPNMQVLPVEEAIEGNLVEVIRDHPWSPPREKPPDPTLWTPELMFLAIQDKVPWSLHDPYVGCQVVPMPHQVFVHKRVLSRPPARFLLADEVGLGKTIEAGLILSSLLATGLARRILILAPANVLKQWDEELRKRFSLEPWVLRGNYWKNKARNDVIRSARPLFAHLPGSPPHILLISRSLMSRKSRLEELKLSSWDLVILDEAHRARGHWEGKERYRKNNLLKALEILSNRTTSLLLLTATPVQLGLNELYDLFNALGMPSSWSDRNQFEAFLDNLNSSESDWLTLFQMAASSAKFYRDLYGLTLDEFSNDLASGVEFFEELSSVENPEKRFLRFVDDIEGLSAFEVPSLNDSERRLLRIALYRMSPFYQLTCRNTRELLRRYQREGKFDLRVPKRIVSPPISIEFSSKERNIYTAIREKYVKPLYRKYAKAGLPTSSVGFVLTIYAKRAASCWEALEKSLSRRLERIETTLREWPQGLRHLFGSLSIKDLVSEGAGEEDEETELEEAQEVVEEVKIGEVNLPEARKVVLEEQEQIKTILVNLSELRVKDLDTKRESLIAHINGVLRTRRGILIFSQYKDTVDYLANKLYRDFGGGLVKYHGGGGEIFRDHKWQLVDKKVVEDKVKSGDVRVLVATDAASEGLNLQALDAIVNYDIPWNPMRIEQRIGRIDRVTQVSETIKIDVLVPEGTVEEDVYSRCLERLNLFKKALGPIQPILVEDFMRKAVLGDGDIEKEWDKAESSWDVARDHVRLFEDALSAHDPKGGWTERREAETKALEHLLRVTDFVRDDGAWVRDGQKISLESGETEGTWLTAAPYNKPFISLLAELGPIPEELDYDGLKYRVIDCGGSNVLAVKHSDGSVYLVEDLANMKAQDATQVGLSWKDANRFADHLEQKRRRSYEKFLEIQRRVREQDWRRGVEKNVLRSLVVWAKGDVSKAAKELVEDPVLSEIASRYMGPGTELSFQQARGLLKLWKAKQKGRRPSLTRLKSRARDFV